MKLPDGKRISLNAYRAMFTAAPAPESGVTAVDEIIAGRKGLIRVRRYLPERRAANDGAEPAIMYLHGGGWVAGSLDSHDRICRDLTGETGAQTVAIDYRLAPEHPFPAAFEDATDAFAIMQHKAAAWGLDPRRIALMGEGSGATLAAITAIHAREMCMTLPFAQLLLYPLVDMTAADDSGTSENAGLAFAAWFRAQYLRNGGDVVDWRVSPLYAESLAGLPPAFVATTGVDRLGRDSIAYARRLSANGGTAEIFQPEAPLRDIPIIRDGQSAMMQAAFDFLKARLTLPPVTV